MADEAKTLQQRRRELLRRRIAESGLTAGQSAQTRTVCAGERYPLSAGQRRIWFLQAMDPTDTTLNICVGYRLTGGLDEARLRAAFAEVVARHAILRTTYGVDTEGEPYQIFADDVEIAWQVCELTDQEVDARARDEFGRPFDLQTELPIRITLIRTGTDEFVLLLVVHHICWDDDSWAVFFDDLGAAYRQQLSGQAPQFGAAFVRLQVDRYALFVTIERAEGRAIIHPAPAAVRIARVRRFHLDHRRTEIREQHRG